LLGMPSDTLVGLQVLKGQFPKLKEVTVAPVVLNTQLYNIVKDRTEVDRLGCTAHYCNR
jgi:isocitrate dehydrogenase kinase/phosphatase